jgi:hypothetical protein
MAHFNSLNYNWTDVYSSVYNITWGKHQWLKSKNEIKWNDKIIINITPYRFITHQNIIKLKEIINYNLDNCIFISNEREHYTYFCEKINLQIDYYKPINFEETVIIINSCKLGLFGFSACSTIANALNKENYMISGNSITDYYLNNIKSTHKFILDILV